MLKGTRSDAHGGSPEGGVGANFGLSILSLNVFLLALFSGIIPAQAAMLAGESGEPSSFAPS